MTFREDMFPVVEIVYNLQQTAIMAAFAEETVYLLGDGQCDSPGHNAINLTYTVMEEDTDLILSSKVVCFGEGEINSSNAMEAVGLDRCIDEVEGYRITVDGVATDRHPQVSGYMKKNVDTWMNSFIQPIG